MKLIEIRNRMLDVETEMRKLYDDAAASGKDLEGQALERWGTLDTELKDLRAKEQRAMRRDDLDRDAPGRDVGKEGERRDLPAGEAWALTPEQRVADFVGHGAGELSLGKVIRGVATGNWRGAEREQRTMGSGVNTTGGFFVPDPISAQVIDLARSKSVLGQAGALTIPLPNSTMTYVRVVTDPTSAWRGEGETITESDATFGAMMLSARSLAALVRINNELLEDVPGFQAQIESQLASALALKLDHAGLYGIGASAQPMGLRNTADVNELSMGDNGAAATDYDKYLDAIQVIEEANGTATACIFAPRTRTKLAKLVTGITSDKTKLVPPPEFTALRRLTSNQVSITETQGSSGVASTAFLGDFAQMALAMRTNLQIEASRLADTAFQKNQTLIRAVLRADTAVFRPTHFARIIGIL